MPGIHGVFNLYSEAGNEPQRLANEKAAKEQQERRAAQGDPNQLTITDVYGPDVAMEGEQ